MSNLQIFLIRKKYEIAISVLCLKEKIGFRIIKILFFSLHKIYYTNLIVFVAGTSIFLKIDVYLCKL